MTSGYLNNADIRGSKGYTPYHPSFLSNTQEPSLYEKSVTGQGFLNIYRYYIEEEGSLGIPQLGKVNTFILGLTTGSTASSLPSITEGNVTLNVYDSFNKTNIYMNLRISAVAASQSGPGSITVHNAWIQNSSGSYNHPFTGLDFYNNFYQSTEPEFRSFPFTIPYAYPFNKGIAFPSIFTYNSISRPSPVVNKFNVRGSSYLVNTTKYNANVRGTKNYFWV